MSDERKLVLEVLSGPLDGAILTLQAGADWSRAGDGPLVFPWEAELGEPQARFTAEEAGWWLEGMDTPHGTYRVNQEEKVRSKVQLEEQDLLKACGTWLLVREAQA
jgi:hypothetical protein